MNSPGYTPGGGGAFSGCIFCVFSLPCIPCVQGKADSWCACGGGTGPLPLLGGGGPDKICAGGGLRCCALAKVPGGIW